MASRHPEEDDDETQEGGGAATPPPPPPETETRWPPFALHHHTSGFWLPEITAKEVLPSLHSLFKPRPATDVILASFPKSGTTWLKALAFATLNRAAHPPPPSGSDHPLRHRSPHDCVPFLGFGNENTAEIEALPSPRLLATHLPHSLLPATITGGGGNGDAAAPPGCRIVYVCREPKDALVSYWLFTRKLAAAGVDFTVEDALELFCEGRCPGGPQWRHVLEYWEASVRRPDRVLFLRYEEMLREPERHVRELARFMGCEFSEEEEEGGVVSEIVEMCSLGKLREVNRNGRTRLGTENGSFFRKGVAGDWSNHLTPEMARRVDEVVQDALQGTGFSFESTKQ